MSPESADRVAAMPPRNGAAPIPRLILSGRPFLGQGAARREEKLSAIARFSNPAAVRDVLSAAVRAGYGSLLTLVEAPVVAALRGLRTESCAPPRGAGEGRRSSQAASSFQILPIVPNVPGYVREATEYGMAGAGMRRLARVGIGGIFRACRVAASHPLKVLRKDFATLLAILCELEMAELRRFAPPVVFLHPQMTDIALSFGNAEFFAGFARRVRTRYGAEPGLATSNFVRLAERLIAWDVPISWIVAPLNQGNHLMPGGLEGYRQALGSHRFRLIADRLWPEWPTPPEAAEWALAQQGVHSAVIDRISFPATEGSR